MLSAPHHHTSHETDAQEPSSCMRWRRSFMPPALMPTLACMVPTVLSWSHTHDTDSIDTVAPSSRMLSGPSESESDDADEDADVIELEPPALEAAGVLASSGSTLPASRSSDRRLLARLRKRSCCCWLQSFSTSFSQCDVRACLLMTGWQCMHARPQQGNMHG